MTIAVYPGSFDPITCGHLDIIKRAACLFDELIVAVFDTPDKRLMFTTSERLQLVARAVADIPNVRAEKYSGLTVDLAHQVGATVIVRGLRAVTDFIREFELALMNKHLDQGIESVLLMASEGYQFLSASLVKEVALLGGNVDGMLPPTVLEAIQSRIKSTTPGS